MGLWIFSPISLGLERKCLGHKINQIKVDLPIYCFPRHTCAYLPMFHNFSSNFLTSKCLLPGSQNFSGCNNRKEIDLWLVSYCDNELHTVSWSIIFYKCSVQADYNLTCIPWSRIVLERICPPNIICQIEFTL